MKKYMYSKGFTLIEMLVAVGLFTFIMVIALGALLVLSGADRRAEDLKTSVDNLNFALDSMSRAIRTGTNFHCGAPAVTLNSIKSEPQNCTTGANYFAFINSDGALVEYQLDTSCSAQACAIDQQITPPNGQPSGFQPLTAPQVIINDTSPIFYVVGAPPKSQGDTIQPKVTMLLHGSVAGSTHLSSTFNLQTSVTQRLYDQ